MNEYLQQGICISPPFPRTEPACLSPNLSSTKNGYHQELHYFENFDYTKVIPQTLLIEENRKRYERIRNCSHNWSKYDLNEIFKSL